jgi:hypothetical protein
MIMFRAGMALIIHDGTRCWERNSGLVGQDSTSCVADPVIGNDAA